jgi:hypothetical protein
MAHLANMLRPAPITEHSVSLGTYLTKSKGLLAVNSVSKWPIEGKPRPAPIHSPSNSDAPARLLKSILCQYLLVVNCFSTESTHFQHNFHNLPYFLSMIT